MRKDLVYYIYEKLQTDLVFMDTKQPRPTNQNDNYKYLPTVINELSKFAWVLPLKNKCEKKITEAFEPILSTVKPEFLQVEKETEFYNKAFKNILDKYNIKMLNANSGKSTN